MDSDPNKLAIAELKKMPSLAGKTPRNIFALNSVVLADLKPRKTSITAAKGIDVGLSLGAFKK